MTKNMTVIYNDTCPICAREVAGYKSAAHKNGLSIAFAGLSECELSRFGLTRDQAAREFHVLRDGQLLSGVAAFAALWETMPRLRWLARLVRLPVIRSVAAWVYGHVLAPALFAAHKRRERLGKARHIA